MCLANPSVPSFSTSMHRHSAQAEQSSRTLESMGGPRTWPRRSCEMTWGSTGADWSVSRDAPVSARPSCLICLPFKHLSCFAHSSWPPVALSSKLSIRGFSQHPYNGPLPRPCTPLVDASPLPSLVTSVYIRSTALYVLMFTSVFNTALGLGFGRPTATQSYHIRAVTVPGQSIWQRVHVPNCSTYAFPRGPAEKVLPSDYRSPPSIGSKCQALLSRSTCLNPVP